jgi:hypothetical protein
VVNFQQGVDNGFGVYSGTVQRRVAGTAYTNVDGSTLQNYFLDGPGAAADDAHDLLKFTGIFGTGPGQIPLGSIINSATLTYNTSTVSNAQTNGPYTVARMLIDWDQTSTYTSLGMSPGALTPGVTSRPSGGFMNGTFQLSQAVAAVADVTILVQDWANGAPNYGFNTRALTSDGWSVQTIGNTNPLLRPRLTVDYTPVTGTVNVASFQEGVDGYAGTISAWLQENNTTTDGSTLNQSFLDGPPSPSPNDQMLIKFDQVFGSNPGQVPLTASIEKAYVVITTGNTSTNARSVGPFGIAQMLVDWTPTSKWIEDFGGNGPTQADNEILAPTHTFLGMIDNGTTYFNVTNALVNWQNGAANYGFNVQSYGTDDGWQVNWPGATDATARPRLVVLWQPGDTSTQPAGTMDITSGILDFNDAAGANTVTFAVSGSNYVITSTSTITLTANAVAASWTGSGTNSVTGPASSVAALKFFLGDGADSMTISGTITGDLTINGGGDVGDIVNIPANLTLSGAANLTALDQLITASGAVLKASSLKLAASAGLGSAADPLLTETASIAAKSQSGGVWINNTGSATIGVAANKAIRVIGTNALTVGTPISNNSGAITLQAKSVVVGNPVASAASIDLSAADGITVADKMTAAGPVTVNANTDGAGAEGFLVGPNGSIGTLDISPDALRVTVNTTTGGTGNAEVASLAIGSLGTMTIDANAGSILMSSAFSLVAGGGAASLPGTLILKTSGAASSIGTPAQRLLFRTGNLFVEAGTGGIYMQETAPNDTAIHLATAKGSGSIDIISSAADGNNLRVVGLVTTQTGDISIRADDDLRVTSTAVIGGSGFSGKIFLEANLDAGNPQVFLQEAGAEISTTNATTDAVLIQVYPVTTASGIGGAVLSNIKVGAGGTITVNAAKTGQGLIRMVDTASKLDAGPTGTVILVARDNAIGEPGVPIRVVAGTVQASTNSTTSTTNGAQDDGDIFVASEVAAKFNASTTTAGTRIGDIELTTLAGDLSLFGLLQNGTGNITLKAAGNIVQLTGQVSTSGILQLEAANSATFTSIGNNAAIVQIPTGLTVFVTGAFDSSNVFNVDGTLAGTGTVGAVNVSATGTLAPGLSPGQLTAGNTALSTGSVFAVELNGTNPGTGYDQLKVNGTFEPNGATLQGSLGFIPPNGSKYRIVDNDGSDSITTTFNNLSEGDTITIGGTPFTITYKGGDGNDIELIAPGVAAPPPTISGPITINGGAQRSMVQSITITFSEPVTLQPGAFKVEGTALGPIGNVGLTISQMGATVTLTFNNSGVAIDPAGSLADGKYRLTIAADKITGSGGATLDGNNNGTAQGSPVDDVTFNFHRLFGDANGDGAVTASDFAAFRLDYGSGGPSIFDFDGVGGVTAGDFNNFRLRYGLAGYQP